MRTGVITREPLVIREAVALGLGWGVFCGIANGWPVASTLAQMAVPWVWAAALAGYRAAANGRQAAVLGGVTLLAANVGYFAIGMLARNIAGLSPVYGIRFFVLWTAVGLVIGPVAGVVGWWLTTARAGVGVVALGIVSIAEPLALGRTSTISTPTWHTSPLQALGSPSPWSGSGGYGALRPRRWALP